MRSHSATSAPRGSTCMLIVVEMAPANRRDVSAEFCNARGSARASLWLASSARPHVRERRGSRWFAFRRIAFVPPLAPHSWHVTGVIAWMLAGQR